MKSKKSPNKEHMFFFIKTWIFPKLPPKVWLVKPVELDTPTVYRWTYLTSVTLHKLSNYVIYFYICQQFSFYTGNC